MNKQTEKATNLTNAKTYGAALVVILVTIVACFLLAFVLNYALFSTTGRRLFTTADFIDFAKAIGAIAAVTIVTPLGTCAIVHLWRAKRNNE